MVAEAEEVRVPWAAIVVAVEEGVDALQLAVCAWLEVAAETQAHKCQYRVCAGNDREAYS